MRPIKITLPILTPRNPFALAAKLRRAGTMRDRRARRAGERARAALQR